MFFGVVKITRIFPGLCEANVRFDETHVSPGKLFDQSEIFVGPANTLDHGPHVIYTHDGRSLNKAIVFEHFSKVSQSSPDLIALLAGDRMTVAATTRVCETAL